ncbi:SDR family oxidoreductase, partial [Pseudothermotoga sp.]
MNFKGKVVLITGAGSGIGRKAAMMFAERGAKVAINDVSEEKGNETVEMIKNQNGEAIFVFGDVSKDAEKIVEKTVEVFGKIDILVNNAGIVPYGNAEETSDEEFQKTIDINVKGPFLLSKHAVKYMKEQRSGVIVNIASEAGLIGIPRRCVYSISKAALLGLTRSFAVDY